MTDWSAPFLPRDTQKLPLQRNLGDAFSAIVKALSPTGTVKAAERDFGCDKSSAKNVVKGVAGGTVVTRAVHYRQARHRDGWRLWLALGELLIGESYDEFQEREYQHIIEAAARVQNNIRLHRAHSEKRIEASIYDASADPRNDVAQLRRVDR